MIPKPDDRTHLLQCAIEPVLSLFNDVPEVLFWVKDRQCRILALNQTFAECVNLPKADILEKSDADLYFPEFARVFMEDDQRVMATGRAIHRKVELLANRFGEVEWRSTTKLPVQDNRGKVIGTAGISRAMTEAQEQMPAQYRAISQITRYCRQHMADGVDVASMAQGAGMSISTLTRQFKAHLRISPGEFLAQLRLSRACHLLTETPLNISEITFECGYESPAAFSRAFRRQMTMSPKDYRTSFTRTAS